MSPCKLLAMLLLVLAVVVAQVSSLPQFTGAQRGRALAQGGGGSNRIDNTDDDYDDDYDNRPRKYGRRGYRSRCRCAKISNCPKLQITIPRCPPEEFVCCF